MTDAQNLAGLGDPQATFQVYIANRPPLPEYQQLGGIKSLHAGEIARIAAETGNHWRKIFNVYAKLLFARHSADFSRWQDLRDQQLLQAGSDQALLFSAPDVQIKTSALRLLLGKGYATELGMAEELHWLDESFAWHRPSGVLVCPYFDYRQLSDEKIRRLVSILNAE